jgi:HEPN domain-containing protein
MGNHENAKEWLRRARSSLAQAEAAMGDVTTRYPGEYSPVLESDYTKAVAIARKALEWAVVKMEETP